ncbi:unnamed protein product, partial [Effrenium voratum]
RPRSRARVPPRPAAHGAPAGAAGRKASREALALTSGSWKVGLGAAPAGSCPHETPPWRSGCRLCRTCARTMIWPAHLRSTRQQASGSRPCTSSWLRLPQRHRRAR